MKSIFGALALCLFSLTAFTQNRPVAKKQNIEKEFQVLKTDGCKQTPTVSDLVLPPLFAWQLLMDNQIKEALVDPSKLCLKFGEKSKLIRSDTKEALAEVSVRSIKIFTYENSIVRHPALNHQWADYRIKNKAHGPDYPYAVVTVKLENLLTRDEKLFTQVAPPIFDYAQYIDGPRFEALKKSRPAIFAVDSKRHLMKLNLLDSPRPIPFSHQLFGVLLETQKVPGNDVYLSEKDLPKQKGHPIVLFGTRAQDFRPLRMAYALAYLGYTNIYIYKGGLMALSSNMELPPISQKFKYIDANQMQNHVLRADTIIDVREKNPSWFTFIIPGATKIEYVEEGNSPRTANLNFVQIKNDSFVSKDLPLAKSAPIIFYGCDAADWRPYKAAVVAANAGFKDIKIFSGGAAVWHYHNLQDSLRFKVLRTPHTLTPSRPMAMTKKQNNSSTNNWRKKGMNMGGSRRGMQNN